MDTLFWSLDNLSLSLGWRLGFGQTPPPCWDTGPNMFFYEPSLNFTVDHGSCAADALLFVVKYGHFHFFGTLFPKTFTLRVFFFF